MNDTTTAARIPLLCRLNIHHKWQAVTNPEDNHRYTRCVHCGKDSPHLGTQGPIG